MEFSFSLFDWLKEGHEISLANHKEYKCKNQVKVKLISTLDWTLLDFISKVLTVLGNCELQNSANVKRTAKWTEIVTHMPV